jgi:hypothetical protein
MPANAADDVPGTGLWSHTTTATDIGTFAFELSMYSGLVRTTTVFQADLKATFSLTGGAWSNHASESAEVIFCYESICTLFVTGKGSEAASEDKLVYKSKQLTTPTWDNNSKLSDQFATAASSAYSCWDTYTESTSKVVEDASINDPDWGSSCTGSRLFGLSSYSPTAIGAGTFIAGLGNPIGAVSGTEAEVKTTLETTTNDWDTADVTVRYNDGTNAAKFF